VCPSKKFRKRMTNRKRKEGWKRKRKLRRIEKCFVFFDRDSDEWKKKGMKGLVKEKVGDEGFGEGKTKGWIVWRRKKEGDEGLVGGMRRGWISW
jgi:hypothetical protein